MNMVHRFWYRNPFPMPPRKARANRRDYVEIMVDDAQAARIARYRILGKRSVAMTIDVIP